MKIKNSDVQPLGGLLVDIRLKGMQSRMRTRFVKLLQQHLDILNEEQQEIVKNYAELDENGNPKTRQENGKEFYVIAEKEQCEKEINELLNEEFIIEENEANKKMLLVVKDLILNCDKEFQGAEAFQYDRFCEVFEDLSYDREVVTELIT
jgi:hypothetical protein